MKQSEKELQQMFTRPIGGYHQGEYRFGATVSAHIHLNKQKVAAYDVHPETKIVEVVRFLKYHHVDFDEDAVVHLDTEFLADKIILYVTTEGWTPVLTRKISELTQKDPPYVETSIKIKKLDGTQHIYKYGSLWLWDTTIGDLVKMRLEKAGIDTTKLSYTNADVLKSEEGIQVNIDMNAVEPIELPEMPYYDFPDVVPKSTQEPADAMNNTRFKNMDRELISLATVKETHVFTFVVFEELDVLDLGKVELKLGPNAVLREHLGVKFLAKAKSYLYDSGNEAVINAIGSNQIQIICSRATKRKDAFQAVNDALVEMIDHEDDESMEEDFAD